MGPRGESVTGSVMLEDSQVVKLDLNPNNKRQSFLIHWSWEVCLMLGASTCIICALMFFM